MEPGRIKIPRLFCVKSEMESNQTKIFSGNEHPHWQDDKGGIRKAREDESLARRTNKPHGANLL